MLFRFLQIVRVSIYHCQSSLSLFPGATLTHSVCPLTHTPKGHFSILPSLMPTPPTPPLEQSADIRSAVQMVGNLARGHYEPWPGPWPTAILAVCLSISSTTGHSSIFPDMLLFLANIVRRPRLENVNLHWLFKQTKMYIRLKCRLIIEGEKITCTHAVRQCLLHHTLPFCEWVYHGAVIKQCGT